MIKIQNNDRGIIGDKVVPGDAKSQCFHHSELCVIIGTIPHINNIFSTYNVLEGSAYLGCGGLEAYKVATRYTYTLSTKLSRYNLSSTLHQLIKASPLSCKFRYVKCHQGDGNTYNNIDEWGRMDIEADRLTKYCLWGQIHAGARHNRHKSISGAIQPTTI